MQVALDCYVHMHSRVISVTHVTDKERASQRSVGYAWQVVLDCYVHMYSCVLSVTHVTDEQRASQR